MKLKQFAVSKKVSDWAAKATSKFDDLFSGGTPFTYIPPVIPTTFLGTVAAQSESLRAQQNFAYRQAMGAQAGMMGGFGGQLLAQLIGAPIYASRFGGHLNILKEGKVSVQVKFTRIDKEHVLVEVECIQRIVHDKKELREVTTKLIEEYAEQYIFGEQPKEVVRADPAAKEATPRIETKPGHE